ncbi:type II CAAX endopeptidase family protein [Methanobacterium alcaliphilum]|uniref:type II CAAX endopeptidase family protein n=1 Tax=Methanobacterium alcaliphilum TaxID=392018 RepID=UPI00200B0BFE|nr:type II CAAX endopeptidase family protein [Methanobacterium alcaliphilum]MCK9151798.1 CPBP family intramembrane metalloprotease [Methanobacterium alcaliphilum]
MNSNKSESHNPVQISEKRNLYLFFIITFLFSWFFWIPPILITHGISFPSLLADFFMGPFNLGAWGPFVAAFLLTYFNNGKEGVFGLLKRGVDYKFHKLWLIPILLLMPFITGVSLIISSFLGDPLPGLSIFYEPWLIGFWFFYLLLLGGPLQEEFGWRGYALDRLQKNRSALTSSIILGVIWAVWHFPLNFAAGAAGPQYGMAISLFIGALITMSLISILFTWIYNNTGRSILAALLFHTSLNLSTFILFPVFEVQSALLFYIILILATAVLVLIIWGRKTLMKDKKFMVSE